MIKLEKYEGTKTYMYPSGKIGDKTAMLQNFPAILSYAHVIQTDEGGEVCFGVYNLSALCAQYGVDASLSEAEKIAMVEGIMNQPPVEPEPTAEERIAAALEYQNLTNL